MRIETRADALAVVRSVLAADYGCAAETWQSDGAAVITTPVRPGGRRYARPAEFLEVATMGAGLVIHCSPAHAALVRERLPELDRPSAFGLAALGWLSEQLAAEGLELSGPNPNYVCGARDLLPLQAPSGIEISVVRTDGIADLYQHPGFPNALGYGKTPIVPDVLATVAKCDGRIVGMAGASAYAEAMWQTGVDVIPEAQQTGIGAALVSRLAWEVFEAGRLPYYAHGLTNVVSAALAARVGFKQAWIEIYARERAKRPGYREP